VKEPDAAAPEPRAVGSAKSVTGRTCEPASLNAVPPDVGVAILLNNSLVINVVENLNSLV
jgi:hypothetical protein